MTVQQDVNITSHRKVSLEQNRTDTKTRVKTEPGLQYLWRIKSTKKLYNKLRLGLTASFPGNYVPTVVLCIVKDFFLNSMSINMYG